MLILRPVEIAAERNKKRKGGSTDEPLQVYVSSLANENGWMPEVTVSAGTGLTDYDLARAERYRQADGTLSAQGREFLKNVSAKRTTGKSQFMQDTDRLAAIPIGAAGLAGGLAMAAAPAAAGHLMTALGGVPVVEALQNKDYGNAALEAGIGFLPIGAVAGRMGRRVGQGIKRVSKPLVNTVNKWLDPKPDLNVYDYWNRFERRVKKKKGKNALDDIVFLNSNTPEARKKANDYFGDAIPKWAAYLKTDPNYRELSDEEIINELFENLIHLLPTAKGFAKHEVNGAKPFVYTTNLKSVYKPSPMKETSAKAVEKYGTTVVENNLIKPHETVHAIGLPQEPPTQGAFKYKTNRRNDYFFDDNATELSARGTQLKDYFNKDKITARDLRYAAKHYVKDTGFDNNMTDMFDGIKDWKAIAKWMTIYSPSVAAPVIMSNRNK